MFPFDSHSARQLREAELIVAQQQRTLGPVVRHRPRRWRPSFARAARPWTADHELFDGLSRTALARAAAMFEVHEVNTGLTLGSQGDTAHDFVAIIEGRVGVTIDGTPHAVLDDGSFLGALPLLDDAATPLQRASFEVMVPSRVAMIDAAGFRQLLDGFPEVAQRIRALADVRRAYLAGVASADRAERHRIPRFPAHLEAKRIRL